MLKVSELLELGRRSKARVGLGGSGELVSDLSRSLRKSSCGVELVGFQETSRFLAELQEGRTIHAAVRGTLGSSQTISGLKNKFQLKEVLRVAVLEDANSRPFLLAPVGIDEGTDYESRLSLARAAVRYFSEIPWTLRVGVLSKGRPEDAGRGAEIKRSLEEGEETARALASEGIRAKHFGILVEDALSECDFVLAPDGVSGNLMFRTLHFVGGRRAFGAPVVNIDRVFVDTSRSKSDFTDSVLLAAGLYEARKR